MIFDHLSHQALSRNAHPNLGPAFDYLLNFDPATPVGKYQIDGDKIFALVQEYSTVAADEKAFESHRRVLDVQYLVEGEEVIYHSPLDRLQVTTEYQEDDDYALYSGPRDQALILRPGFWAVFFPQDAHMPCCASGAPAPARKVVVKVQL
jgi:biofilm protein TabA